MKQKWFGLTVLLSVILFLSCCSYQRPLFRLTPETDQTTWLFGKEYSKQSQNGLITAIAFEKYTYNHIVFDVSISNISSEDVLIAPENFYYLTSDSSLSKPRIKIFAIDPELQLIEAEKQSSKEEARYSKTTDLYLFSSFLGLLSDVSSAGKSKTEEEREAERLDDEEERQDREESEIWHKEKMHDLNELRSEWEVGALRKTTLKERFTIHGKVYFHRNDQTEWIQVNFPLGESCFQFGFHQEQIQVESNGC